MFTHIHIFMCIYVCVYIYIYIYIYRCVYFYPSIYLQNLLIYTHRSPALVCSYLSYEYLQAPYCDDVAVVAPSSSPKSCCAVQQKKGLGCDSSEGSYCAWTCPSNCGERLASGRESLRSCRQCGVGAGRSPVRANWSLG